MDTNNHKAKRLTSELHALTEVAKTITIAQELPELLDAILDKIIGVLQPAEIGAVMLWDQSAGLFRPVAAFGYNADILSKIGLRAGEAITGKVYDDSQARLLKTPEEVSQAMGDMRQANRVILSEALNSDAMPICTLAAPIIAGGQKYGVLVLETLQGPALFVEEDIPFVQVLADLIALAIERARLRAKADVVREARESERLRSELMATLSHELRLPLTAIKGYASALLLEEVEWSPEKQGEFVRLIEEECDHMQVLLTEILDSSLIDVSQMTIKPQQVCLGDIARDVATELQRRNTTHRLVVDFPSAFPTLNVDPHWIKQVFRNILDNAIKYSPEGGLIVVSGEVRPLDVVISIADQGLGISPENLIPLFEKYFRASLPTGYQIPGTGLGLPVARAIVEAHEGRIWAESELGQGTTVSFSLPRQEDE